MITSSPKTISTFFSSCLTVEGIFRNLKTQVLHYYEALALRLPILPFSVSKLNPPQRETDATIEANLSTIQSVIDVIKEGVILLDDEGNILAINAFIEQLWDISRTDWLGKPIKKLFAPVAWEDFDQNWAKRDSPPQTFQSLGLKPNQSLIPLGVILQKPKIGARSYYMLNVHDFSGQKKIETELSEKKAELDTLIYKLSHDLRGPLASILGLLSLTHLEGIDSNAIKNYVGLIERSAFKLDTTLNELIFFSEISARPCLYSSFSMVETLQKVLDDVLEAENCEGVNFKVEIAEKDATLCSDVTLVKNILHNLISNSVKYKAQGRNTQVKISIKKYSHHFEMLVEDNGQGISKEVLPKVFDMFYRGNTSSQGSGLGLFLVKQSVDKLQGKVEINSKRGEKTECKINLPLAKVLS